MNNISCIISLQSVVLVVYWVHDPTQVYIYISRGVFSDRLEPKAADAKFVASIEMVEGVPKVMWLPDLGAERVYRVLGAKGLLPAAGETHRGTGLGSAAGETHRGTGLEALLARRTAVRCGRL